MPAGLPAPAELTPCSTTDGGVWGQPFRFKSLAHVIIPAEFYWERIAPGEFENGVKTQDLHGLSRELTQRGIQHRVTDHVLEIKLY